MSERVCILWECPHCGYKNISSTSIKGTGKVGSRHKPMRFVCLFDGCRRKVRVANKFNSTIIAAVAPQKRWKLEDLQKQIDLGKSRVDIMKIWDPEWKKGDEIPFAFRRWKKWVGDV